LDTCPSDLAVELTGGEIGLVPNIDTVYETVVDHPHVKHIAALSNGLLRRRNPYWLDGIEYWEHLIQDIEGKNIKLFYDDLDLEQGHRYIIVTTESTTKSLLEHWDWFEERGLFRPNFFYKLMNHKSNLGIYNYKDKLLELYKRLGDKYFQRMLMHYHLSSYLSDEKKLCQKFPPNIYVDLQNKHLGHCAMNVRWSTKVAFNAGNLDRMMSGGYSTNDYCQLCYSFDNGYNRSKFRNRSYQQS
jgi:hypothetical protein